jgi:hypothetical protein
MPRSPRLFSPLRLGSLAMELGSFLSTRIAGPAPCTWFIDVIPRSHDGDRFLCDSDMTRFERPGPGDVGQIYFMLPSVVACGKRTHRCCRQGLRHSLLPTLMSDACSIPSGDTSAGRQRRRMRQRRCRIGPRCRSGDAVILLHVCPTFVLYGADWSAIDVSLVQRNSIVAVVNLFTVAFFVTASARGQ